MKTFKLILFYLFTIDTSTVFGVKKVKNTMEYEWEYQLSSENQIWSYLAGTKQMAKEMLFERAQNAVDLVTSDPLNDLTMTRILLLYKYAEKDKQNMKPIIFMISNTQTFEVVRHHLTNIGYYGNWFYLRLEVAMGYVRPPLMDINTLQKQFNRKMRFVLAWSDAHMDRNAIRYSHKAIEAMQIVLRMSNIALRFYTLLEVDLLLASHTPGLRTLFPHFKGIIITSSRKYKIIKKIDFVNFFYLCHDFGIENTYLEINNTRLRKRILLLLPSRSPIPLPHFKNISILIVIVHVLAIFK